MRLRDDLFWLVVEPSTQNARRLLIYRARSEQFVEYIARHASSLREIARTDHDAEQTERNEKNDGARDDQRAHGLAKASMLDDCEDQNRQDEAERQNDSDAGRQVKATPKRLKPLACLAM